MQIAVQARTHTDANTYSHGEMDVVIPNRRIATADRDSTGANNATKSWG